eukprot:jgi/Mesen1/7849/ME000042S07293
MRILLYLRARPQLIPQLAHVLHHQPLIRCSQQPYSLSTYCVERSCLKLSSCRESFEEGRGKRLSFGHLTLMASPNDAADTDPLLEDVEGGGGSGTRPVLRVGSKGTRLDISDQDSSTPVRSGDSRAFGDLLNRTLSHYSGGYWDLVGPTVLVVVAVLQWWFFNIVVVIGNKWIFQEFLFMFPMTLTTVHFLVSWLGSFLCIKVFHLSPLLEVKAEDRLSRVFPLAAVSCVNIVLGNVSLRYIPVFHLSPLLEVKAEDRLSRVFPLAAVSCVNIVLGNVSLRYIPVSFVQTIKALTPACTVLLSSLVWRKKFHTLIYLSLLPVVGGMILSSITELSFQWVGFTAALASCFITSTGVILADLLLSGKYKFDSINTVYHMVPYSLQLLVIPALLFEGRGVATWLQTTPSLAVPLAAIVLSGMLAFGLNFSLYAVIKVTSAVTFCVVGNFKVAVAVLCSWLVFRNPMSLLSVLGCGITIGGCTYYGYLQNMLSQKPPPVTAADTSAAAMRENGKGATQT